MAIRARRLLGYDTPARHIPGGVRGHLLGLAEVAGLLLDGYGLFIQGEVVLAEGICCCGDHYSSYIIDLNS